jgi:hypothetical protein
MVLECISDLVIVWNTMHDRLLVFGGGDAMLSTTGVGCIYRTDLWTYTLQTNQWAQITPIGTPVIPVGN